jgi:hypothetical protein
MNINDLYDSLRAYVYAPGGLAATTALIAKYFDGKEGNENLVALGLAGYFLVNGIVGIVNKCKKTSGLEDRVC